MQIKLYTYLCCLTLLLLTAEAKTAVILQYHHVSETTPLSTSISPQLFEQHLIYLEQNNYKIWPLSKLVKHLKSHKPIPDRVVIITFDDAYQSIYKNAFPLLKKKGWPFTVFVATNSINVKSKIFMSWDQLKEMANNKATIANHTQNHTHLVRYQNKETSQQWRKRITNEILDAEQTIEQEIGLASKMLAYPYGEYTLPLKSLVNELDYIAFGQQSGAVGLKHDLAALPRFPMTNTFGVLSQFKTKVESLPLFPLLIKPSKNLIANQNHFSKGLSLTFPKLEVNVSRFNCFLSEFGKVDIKITELKYMFEVKVEEQLKLSSGRSRLNCTAPTTNKNKHGRFYWFSHTWLKKLDNGNWYIEK